MSCPLSFSASIGAWGAVRLGLAEIAPRRKRLPTWAPESTAGHFLKYADEQTVAAVAAVEQAIQSFAIDLARQRDWPIIAAPRFLGRIAGSAVIFGYDRGGPQSVSPHIIPQNSLHSVSGALSILLGSRGPNVGVGGGPESLDDAILAAFSLPGAGGDGCWLVATAWDPEPVADLNSRMINQPVCHAVALVLRFAATNATCGELSLRAVSGERGTTDSLPPGMSVSRLVSSLDQAGRGELRLAWNVRWDAEVDVVVRTAAMPHRAAA